MNQFKINRNRKMIEEAVYRRTVCGSISAALGPDCTYPIIGAMEPILWLANRADIASFATTGTIVTGITMVATKKFYAYEGIKQSNNAKDDLVKGKYLTNFDHTLELIVFNVYNAAKVQLEKMSRGLVVGIIENKFKGASGGGAFEIFGKDQGLEMAVLNRDRNNTDTNGAYTLTLKTPDVGKEGGLPATFLSTDYATTVTAIAALIA